MYFANDYRLIRHGTILATSRKKSSIFSMKENMSREIAMRLYKVFSPLCFIRHIIYLFSAPVTAVLELVSKELNHLAAILHVYTGGLHFLKKKMLLFLKKKMEILLHF